MGWVFLVLVLGGYLLSLRLHRSVAARPAKAVALSGVITGLFTLTHIAGAVAAVALTARSGWGREWA